MGELIENFMLIWWLNGSIICEVDKEAERWKGKGRRETQKELRRLVLGKFFLAKGEGNEKDE